MSKDKAKAGKNFSSRMQGARAVWVAVGILALAFLVGVLAPAWYFAGRLVDNNTAVRRIGELQQQPSRMQAALNSIQDRLRARGFVRDSIEQLKRATQQFESSTSNLTAGGVMERNLITRKIVFFGTFRHGLKGQRSAGIGFLRRNRQAEGDRKKNGFLAGHDWVLISYCSG